jgi:BASS family bile acid:Na+ symporter
MKWVDWVHHHFLVMIIVCYLLGALFPSFGLAVSGIHFGIIGTGEEALKLSIPFFMLSMLLFNSGLSVKQSELKTLRHHPGTLVIGIALNFALPLSIIYIIAKTLSSWHNQDEFQNILVGLALVGAMPIAASSTAWTQKGNGNLALSLGLILLSTLLSPLTTPMALHFSGSLTSGDYSEDLHLLADGNANIFLMLSVVIPSVAGLLLHWVIKEAQAAKLRHQLKELNLLILLLLNYFNASHVLPGIFQNPDWDYLGIIIVVTLLLCVSAFGVAWLTALAIKTDASNRIALTYGLGMNNNGTGLVLASMTLSDHPLVMLPIIIYNLLQHIVAGVVDKLENDES